MWTDKNCPYPSEQYRASYGGSICVCERISDCGKGTVRLIISWHQIVGLVEICVVYFAARYECLSIKHLVRIWYDRRDFLWIDHDVIAAPSLEALDLLVSLYDLFGLAIDELALQAVAGFFVDHMETDPLGCRRGRIKANGT
ncbi:hypothetical protein D3C71_1194540 [compost metagenome]